MQLGTGSDVYPLHASAPLAKKDLSTDCDEFKQGSRRSHADRKEGRDGSFFHVLATLWRGANPVESETFCSMKDTYVLSLYTYRLVSKRAVL